MDHTSYVWMIEMYRLVKTHEKIGVPTKNLQPFQSPWVSLQAFDQKNILSNLRLETLPIHSPHQRTIQPVAIAFQLGEAIEVAAPGHSWVYII